MFDEALIKVIENYFIIKESRMNIASFTVLLTG